MHSVSGWTRKSSFFFLIEKTFLLSSLLFLCRPVSASLSKTKISVTIQFT